MPEENHSGVVSISGTARIHQRGGDVVDGAASRGDPGASGQAAANGGSECADAGTVAPVVAGGVSTERILEMGAGATAPTGGGGGAAVVVAGVF